MTSCDKCDKPATSNIASELVEYRIDERGQYDRIGSVEVIGTPEEFYCSEHHPYN